MKTIALIDTRPEFPGQTIGTLISTYGTMLAAFKGNEAFRFCSPDTASAAGGR